MLYLQQPPGSLLRGQQPLPEYIDLTFLKVKSLSHICTQFAVILTGDIKYVGVLSMLSSPNLFIETSHCHHLFWPLALAQANRERSAFIDCSKADGEPYAVRRRYSAWLVLVLVEHLASKHRDWSISCSETCWFRCVVFYKFENKLLFFTFIDYTHLKSAIVSITIMIESGPLHNLSMLARYGTRTTKAKSIIL